MVVIVIGANVPNGVTLQVSYFPNKVWYILEIYQTYLLIYLTELIVRIDTFMLTYIAYILC
jgi:hypothetical protein